MNRSLPAWPIVKRALLMPIQHGVFTLAIGWPVILLTAWHPLAVLLALVDPPSVTSEQKAQMAWNVQTIALGAGALLIPFVYAFLLTVIAVFWHRHVLLQESRPPLLPLRFDMIQLRYIGYAILVSVVIVGAWFLGSSAIVLILALMAQWGDSTIGKILLVVGFLVLFPLSFYILVAFFRLSLVLPAAAIGHRGFGLREAWRASSGNSWTILGMHLLLMPILIIIVIPLTLIIVYFGGTGFSASPGGSEIYVTGATGLRLVLFAVANAALNLYFTLVGIGMLSLTYAYLIYDPPKQDAQMEA